MVGFLRVYFPPLASKPSFALLIVSYVRLISEKSSTAILGMGELLAAQTLHMRVSLIQMV